MVTGLNMLNDIAAGGPEGCGMVWKGYGGQKGLTVQTLKGNEEVGRGCSDGHIRIMR